MNRLEIKWTPYIYRMRTNNQSAGAHAYENEYQDWINSFAPMINNIDNLRAASKKHK